MTSLSVSSLSQQEIRIGDKKINYYGLLMYTPLQLMIVINLACVFSYFAQMHLLKNPLQQNAHFSQKKNELLDKDIPITIVLFITFLQN